MNEPQRPMIRLEGLAKRYGDFVAVAGLDLTVEVGEVFGFLGPNGAGKTTTLRMLTGLIQPTSGRAWIGGYDMAKNPLEAKALIGFIPDRPYLYEKRSFFTLPAHGFRPVFLICKGRQGARAWENHLSILRCMPCG